MASFAGTTQKCMACDKTAYLVDRLTADGRIFHKACFRCHHCKNTLKLSNYCSFEGVLYCRPHYDQLFKRTGSLERSFEGAPKIQKPERQTENENTKILSNVFLGTKDKCAGCQKTVYPTERVTINGTPYHKGCFKCSHGGCTISAVNFITHEGKLYCKHHHVQLFKEKGNYSQLDGDREKNPINSDEATALKENEESEESQDREAQLYEEQGRDDGWHNDREHEHEHVGDNPLDNPICQTDQTSLVSEDSLPSPQNTSCSSSPAWFPESNVEQLPENASDNGDPSHGILISSNNKEREVSKESVTELSHSGSERENRDPQTVLEKLNLQLVDKSGRAMKIQVTYRTNEKKKKRAQKDSNRLAASDKGGNGKFVKS